MFGVSWGTSQEKVIVRFGGIKPSEVSEWEVCYPLAPIIDRMELEERASLTALRYGQDRVGDEISFGFSDDGLCYTQCDFGFGFEEIGQDSDTLSDMAMAAFARTELQTLLFDLAGFYGPHYSLAEQPMRTANRHLVGIALFQSAETLVRAGLGYDHSAIVGSLTLRASPVDLT